MTALATILAAVIPAILRVLLPFLADRAEKRSEDGARQPALREQLRDRVRSRWVGAAVPLLLAALLMLLGAAAGCNPRTIYVPTGEPVRLRSTIKRAPVWVLDKDGNPVAGRMDLPEGWYCLPVPDVQE